MLPIHALCDHRAAYDDKAGKVSRLFAEGGITRATVTDETKLRRRHRNAYWALYIVGSLTVLLGLAAELFAVDVLLQALGSGWIVAVEGAALLALGYFTMRGSLIALGFAIALYGIDALLTLLGGAVAGIGLRALVLYFLIQGFLALRTLKQRRSGLASPSAPASPTAPAEPPSAPPSMSGDA